MKKLLLGLVLLVMYSCGDVSVERVVELNTYQVDGVVIHTYDIDSCEYLGYIAMGSTSKYLTHKGNCRYCIERNRR